MGGNRDVSCADGVTTGQSDGSGQSRVGRTEGTVEEREERGHGMRGRGGGREELLDSNIIVNVGDLVLGVMIPGRCRCRSGRGGARQGQSRRQERDQDRVSI